MPTVRLTKRSISEIPLTEQGQVLYRDALLTGFGLRVGTRSKAYFVEGQVNRRTVRTTIGRADLFSPEVARRKALTILGEMVEGNDPNAAKHQLAAGGITLEDAFTGMKPYQRAGHRAATIRMRQLALGAVADPDDDEEFPAKPLWQRWPTYHRLKAEHEQLMAIYWHGTVEDLSQTLRSWGKTPAHPPLPKPPKMRPKTRGEPKPKLMNLDERYPMGIHAGLERDGLTREEALAGMAPRVRPVLMPNG